MRLAYTDSVLFSLPIATTGPGGNVVVDLSPVFMSDLPGLLENPKNPDSVISQLKVSAVDGLKKSGVVDKGMIPKVDSAVTAIQSGVEKVAFVDGRVPHSVLLEIFTDEGIGTEVVI